MTQTEQRNLEPAGCACDGPCGTTASNFTINRRAAIGAGVVAGAALVAGCGSSTPTTAASTTTAAAGGPLAKVADVPDGGSLVVTVDKKPYALFKGADGKVVVHTGICTHMQCAVAASGTQLKCPCHGSVFDAATGAVVNGPANGPLASINITETGGNVVLA
jgi:cytochrome b6-f complex iron-sulfur subunit